MVQTEIGNVVLEWNIPQIIQIERMSWLFRHSLALPINFCEDHSYWIYHNIFDMAFVLHSSLLVLLLLLPSDEEISNFNIVYCSR